jgi:hypothetical protein
MKRRRAVSLVELLLAMSAAVIILSLSAELIHRLMHATSKAQSVHDAERSARRLAASFRQDVHDASAADLKSDPAGGVLVKLTLDGDEVVEYRRAGASVLREVGDGTKTTARERYILPPGALVDVAEDESMLVLSIQTKHGEVSPPDHRLPMPAYAVPLHIEIRAALGKLRGLTGRTEGRSSDAK